MTWVAMQSSVLFCVFKDILAPPMNINSLTDFNKVRFLNICYFDLRKLKDIDVSISLKHPYNFKNFSLNVQPCENFKVMVFCGGGTTWLAGLAIE